MSDPTNNSEEILKKLSRRKLLRNSAITATGVALLPSFLTGCHKDIWEKVKEQIPGGGLGGAPSEFEPTLEELKAAAENLHNMRKWLEKLHSRQTDYEFDMLEYLKSGNPHPSGWKDFIMNIVVDIVVGIISAAAAASEAATAGAATAGIAAALAVTVELVQTFTASDVNANLDGVFAQFKTGQDNLYNALDNALIRTASDNGNYKNLKEVFKGGKAIVFRGKPYTFSDLANGDFPTQEHNGDVFVDLLEAAMLQFRKYFWNVMITKAGKMAMNYTGNNDVNYADESLNKSAHRIAQEIYENEPDRVASYMRAYYDGGNYWNEYKQAFYFAEFIFEFDGKRLPAAVAQFLFIDNVRDNIINPDGLFKRDYVYKQFHLERPDFGPYHEVGRFWDLLRPYEANLDVADDNYEFTGGLLKSLTKPG